MYSNSKQLPVYQNGPKPGIYIQYMWFNHVPRVSVYNVRNKPKSYAVIGQTERQDLCVSCFVF